MLSGVVVSMDLSVLFLYVSWGTRTFAHCSSFIVGTTLTCVIGFAYFGDSMSWIKIMALVAIIVGCAVLKFAE